MINAPGRLMTLLFAISLTLALAAACGGDDAPTAEDAEAATGGGNGNQSSGDSSGPIEMVPLSSLELDLPFEFSYDPPVPSDATVANAREREATDNTFAGYDLTLNTSATYEDMQAAYDAYVANFELSMHFPDSQAWTGRRAEGEPGITIGVIGERLNIAEILDN